LEEIDVDNVNLSVLDKLSGYRIFKKGLLLLEVTALLQ